MGKRKIHRFLAFSFCLIMMMAFGRGNKVYAVPGEDDSVETLVKRLTSGDLSGITLLTDAWAFDFSNNLIESLEPIATDQKGKLGFSYNSSFSMKGNPLHVIPQYMLSTIGKGTMEWTENDREELKSQKDPAQTLVQKEKEIPPTTDDATRIASWIVLLIASFVSLFMIIRIFRKKR